MLFAGVVEVPPEVVFALLAGFLLAAVAFAAIGALITAWTAQARGAWGLGAVTSVVTALLLLSTVSWGLAVLGGWGASALVGSALRARRQRNELSARPLRDDWPPPPPTDTN